MRLGILLSAALVAVADKRVVNVDGWEKSPLFSHAVVSGDTVYVSGMIGVDMSTMKLCPGGVYNQTLCAFANIETMLHAAGTSLDKVLDCTCFVGDLATDFDKMNEAYDPGFFDAAYAWRGHSCRASWRRSRVAEDRHVPYEVLILDHPSVSSFDHLRLIGDFAAAALPVVLALSDADATRLAAWVRGGGRLAAVDWAADGPSDEEWNGGAVLAGAVLAVDPVAAGAVAAATADLRNRGAALAAAVANVTSSAEARRGAAAAVRPPDRAVHRSQRPPAGTR
ncbi:endoribonuclease [Aureococcus anophagefferens]|nr:endoribonuclease [Aureococcus anophagefferens]